MPNYGTRITKIVNGHRIMEYIEIVPNYRVTFLGDPAEITFQVGTDIYVRNQIGVFPDGTYPYTARVSGDPSYGEVSGTFVISGGDITVFETMSKQNFALSIHAESLLDDTLEDVELYLNDKYIGKTNGSGNFVYNTIGGIYNLIGRKAGFLASTASVVINGNKSISIVLSSVDPQAPANGIASITSIPSGAQVFINGVFEGITPMTKVLSPNNYNYSLKLSGYRDYIGTFRITSNNVSSVSGALIASQVGSTLSITSNVAGVQISNVTTGEVYGFTPLTKNVPGNINYSLVGRKAGYVDKTFNIYAQEAQTHAYYVELSSVTDYPASGTLVETYCQGYDQYGKYHDGNGGFYNQLIEANSAACNYPVKATVTVEDNSTNSKIYIYKSDSLPNPLPVSGSPDTSLPTPLYTFTKSARSQNYTLPVGSYTFVSVPIGDSVVGETRSIGGRTSKIAILNISTTVQTYYVSISNYREIKNKAYVVSQTDIANGTLTDYLQRDTFGNTGWTIIEAGNTFTYKPYINLTTVGNPSNSNGTQSIRTSISFDKKYLPTANLYQSRRSNWATSTIISALPEGLTSVKEASVVLSSMTSTVGTVLAAQFTNVKPTSADFSYAGVNNTSRAVITFRFTVEWWEPE